MGGDIPPPVQTTSKKMVASSGSTLQEWHCGYRVVERKLQSLDI